MGFWDIAILVIFGDKMASLGPINYKIVFYTKVNVNEGHISKRLAKMSINWHRINQMPLLCVNIKWS